MTGESKERPQRGENFGRDIVIDRGHGVQNWLKFEVGHGGAKRYYQGGYDLVLDIVKSAVGPKGEAAYLRVRVHNALLDDGNALSHDEVFRGDTIASGALARDGNLPIFAGGRSGVQQPVFIDPIKVMDTPKGMFAERRAQVVRLEALDDVLRRWVNSSYLESPTVKGGQSGLPRNLIEPGASDAWMTAAIFIPEDRELAALGDVIGERFGVSDGEFIGQEVERRARIVKALADYQRQWVGGWLRSRRNHQNVAGLVLVHLESDSVSVALDPFLAEGIDLLQVALRAQQFEFSVGVGHEPTLKED